MSNFYYASLFFCLGLMFLDNSSSDYLKSNKDYVSKGPIITTPDRDHVSKWIWLLLSKVPGSATFT